MTQYIVVCQRIIRETWLVEADSSRDAARLWVHGKLLAVTANAEPVSVTEADQ